MNQHIAWGSTVNPTDVTDVFQESVVVARRRPGGDDLQRCSQADADLPADLPRQPAGNGTADDLVVVPPSASVPRLGRDAARSTDRRQPQRPVHRLLRDPGARLLPGSSRAGDDGGGEAGPATSTSARRTGCSPTTAATSRTTPITSCRCARISRRASSTGCAVLHPRRDKDAAPRGGSPPGRGPETMRSRSRSSPTPSSISSSIPARLDLEREPGSDRADLRQRRPRRASARRRDPLRLGRALGREPERPRHEAGRRARRREDLVRRAAVGAGGRGAERRGGARACDRVGAAARPDARHSPALAALGSDPRVQEAVARLGTWQFSTPTGIPEG